LKHEDYELFSFKLGSPKFDKYYKMQLPFIGEQEFVEFTNTLKEKLPVTFRVNQTEVSHEVVCQMFTDKQFIKRYYLGSDKVEGVSEEDWKNKSLDLSQVQLAAKKYYPPGDVLFELTVPRELLKKNLGLKAIHKLVQKAGESGILTRQEIVSMLPPLLLGVDAEHAVFDMCAAPGSKTAQLVELMQCSHVYDRGQSNTAQTKGFIIANDADDKRAFMLTHQMNRLNTANMVILNHNA
jgi:multisite-specific tRNA:(cytosine-C5)-methyltransferase